MPIVLAAVAAEPVDETGPSPRKMTWTGFDGSFWPLTRPDAVNPQMRPGVQGLHNPPMTVHKSSTALVSGAELLGYSVQERPVYWPLLFRAASADAWRTEHGAFFDSFHPTRPGVWAVGEGAEERTLLLTGVFDGSHAFDRDPFVSGRAVIGLMLEAASPMWRGRTVSATFYAEEDLDFIPDDPGDTYYLSNASLSEAEISNPGDEPAYLTWTVTGPQDDLLLGVGGAIIDVPFAVGDGQTLVIDTDPTGPGATLDGVDCTAALGFQVFGQVPARSTAPLSITSTGTGSVRADLTPLYWRAF